jgi:hypothetical protein
LVSPDPNNGGENMATRKTQAPIGYGVGTTDWRREEDPTARRYVSYDGNSVEDFLRDSELILDNLSGLLDRELSFVRGGHLVRLRVELELSH